ncbi:MAG: HAD hydrolase family protein [Planctomycetales bacterium]|nr:HAD hydrolase family protein [Planctomycetales bacterium]
MKLDARCQQIKMLLSDVDGVLTDGGVIFDNQGIEIKKFHIRDGLGIKLWQRAGYPFGIVTARNSHIVKVRAAELGVQIVRQGFEKKLPTVHEIVQQQGITIDEVAYIGDDLTDLPVLKAVGLPVAVADAAAEVRSAAQLVTKIPGGKGAVRETIETILKAQKRWDDLIQRYQ